MAIDLSSDPLFAGRHTAPTAEYPFGSSKNDTTGTANDGTPYIAKRADDLFGFQQAILSEAGITPSGDAETATNSQYLEGIKSLTTQQRDSSFEVTVGGGGDYATLNDAITALSKQYPVYSGTSPVKATVRMLAGFSISEQVFVDGIDLSWITIVGDDAQTTIITSAITQSITNSINNFIIPVFSATGGTLPRINQTFTTNGSASGKRLIALDNSYGNIFDIEFNGNAGGDMSTVVEAVNSAFTITKDFTDNNFLNLGSDAFDLVSTNMLCDEGMVITSVGNAINADSSIIRLSDIDCDATVRINECSFISKFSTMGSLSAENSVFDCDGLTTTSSSLPVFIVNSTGNLDDLTASGTGSDVVTITANSNISLVGANISATGSADPLTVRASQVTVFAADILGQASPYLNVQDGAIVRANTATNTVVNITPNTLTSIGIYFES